jgi:hypothetical protein
MVYDYSRSSVTFVTEGRRNNARLQIESVCTLSDIEAGLSSDYVFYASCKSEHTFAERDLFIEENYDFCGIFSSEEYAIFRTHVTHAEGFREEGRWRDRFEDVKFDLVETECEPLQTNRDIVQASLDNIPLVGSVEISSGRLKAEMQFPIKTMNANDIEDIYQVDTGPIPFPNFEADVDRQVQRLSPAYVAYNAPDFADFVVQQPVDVGNSVRVTHYANPLSLRAETAVLAVCV